MVDAHELARIPLRNAGLKQTEDTPFWFEDSPINSGINCTDPVLGITYSNRSGVECLMRVLDQIDFLDYVNNPASMELYVKFEFDLTNSTITQTFNGNRPVLALAHEVGPLAYTTNMNISFVDELRNMAGNSCLQYGGGFQGRKCMETVSQHVQHYYNNWSAYAGYGLEIPNTYSASNPSLSQYAFPATGGIGGISIHSYDDYVNSAIISNFP